MHPVGKIQSCLLLNHLVLYNELTNSVAPELSSIKVSCLIIGIRKVDEAVLFRTSCLKERGLEI
jgi:hypothetical protein